MGGSTSAQDGGRKRPAWTALKHGQQVKGMGLVPVPFSFTGANSVTFSFNLFNSLTYALGGEWQVVGCSVTSDSTIASALANGFRFQVRNIGTGGSDTDDLSASGYSTLTKAITADVPFTIPIEGPDNSAPKNVFVGEGETLQLHASELGAGPDLSSTIFTGTLYMLNSPPGRSGTP